MGFRPSNLAHHRRLSLDRAIAGARVVRGNSVIGTFRNAGRYGGLAPKDPFGNTKAGFRATGKPNRKGYGLVWSKALDSGGVAGGDEVDWVANLERIKK